MGRVVVLGVRLPGHEGDCEKVVIAVERGPTRDELGRLYGVVIHVPEARLHLSVARDLLRLACRAGQIYDSHCHLSYPCLLRCLMDEVSDKPVYLSMTFCIGSTHISTRGFFLSIEW